VALPKPYLCTGFDAFVLREPCTMSANPGPCLDRVLGFLPPKGPSGPVPPLLPLPCTWGKKSCTDHSIHFI